MRAGRQASSSKADQVGPLRRYAREAVVALTVVAAAALLRLAIELVIPGVVPFALMFPAVLAATVLSGWRAGATTVAVGGALTWFMVIKPRFSFALVSVADAVSIVLFVVSASAIVVFAEAYRRGVQHIRSTAEIRLRDRSALAESETRLRLATQAAGVGVWEWRLDTNEMIYSARACEICGFDPKAPVTHRMVLSVTHPDDLPNTSAQARRALDPEIRDRAPYEYRIVRTDGQERWVTANGEAVFEEREGRTVATRYVGTLIDITERRRAEDAVRASEAQLRLALEAGRMAVWRVDAQGRLESNPDLKAVLGYPPNSEPGLDDLREGYLPGELERLRGAAAAALERGDRFFEVEFQYRRPDGEVRWLNTRAELLLQADGQPSGAIGVVMDVTERRTAQDRLSLLAREVDHRANNLMTVVQGTVALSEAASAPELKQVITGRVHALARAHQLLSDTRWEGADLRRLVQEELLAYTLGEAARVSISGPDVALGPAAAQAIAMALHELSTNAAKYGALSTAAGRVEIAWTGGAAGEPLRIRWTERGGPPVTPPSRKGFGASVIRRSVSGALGGDARIHWQAEGVVCEIDLPAQSLAAA